MKKNIEMTILIGKAAKEFLNLLSDEDINWNSRKLNKNIKGGIINSSENYTAFSCCGNETFVEDFDDIVEAAKYANGIEAKTINNEYI